MSNYPEEIFWWR